MRIECKYDEMMSLSDAESRRHPDNENDHPEEQIRSLAKVIAKIGVRHAIHISKLSGKIAGGHGRLLAFKKLGYDEVPVVWENFADELEEINYRASDNLGQYAEFNNQEYVLNLEKIGVDIHEIDLEEFGVIDFTPEIEVLEPEGDPDAVPEVKEDPIAKRGDIWLLDDHRLMCGDSTMIDDVEKLMNGEKADMVFTDPPYGVSYTGGVIHGSEINKDKKREMIKNDDDLDIYRDWLSILGNFIDDGAIYIFYATRNSYHIFQPLHEMGFDLHAVIAWNKINTGYADMNSHYKNKYEPCIYAKKHGKKLNFVGPTTENTVWDIEKDRNNKMHPTQKPVAVPERGILNSSNRGNVILESFCGSGSTLIACEKTNRKCYGMELDEKYCDVIIKRWQDYTGKDAILESSGETYNALSPKETKEE